MRKKRRPKTPPVIGRVPGQKGTVIIEPSQLHIERKPDNVIIHDRGREQRHTVEGREHHFHVHTGQRESPEPTFDFLGMNQQLMERIRKHVQKQGTNIGLGGPFENRIAGTLKEAAYYPKFRGKQGPIRSLTQVRKVIMDQWKGIHPFKLAGELLTTKAEIKGKSVGIIGYRRTKKKVEAAKKLREKYAPKIQKAYEQYLHESEQALASLMDAFEAGKINRTTYNRHMENYEKALKKAENNFTVNRKKILDQHNEEWNKVR